MDTADPSGFSRSPTGTKANQIQQSEIVDEEKQLEDSGGLEKGQESLDREKTEVMIVKEHQKEASDLEMRNHIRRKGSENLTRGSEKGGSWAEVAQEKKVLKKYDIQITEKEGEKIVEIPDDVIEKGNPLWEDYLIGKFLDTAPHIARVHATVNRIWTQGEQKQIDVHIVDDTTMKFKVINPAMRARILRRGMWNIGNVPLVVTKWTPDELKEKPEIKSIPMWIHLKNVPMNMFSWQGLSFITSAAGSPVRLHPETASCSNFKLAKIFVNVDLSKELPDKINFTKNGKSSLVEFIYPWLPLRCRLCGKWGHGAKVCVMNKKEETEKSVQKINEEVVMKKDAVVEKNEEKKKNTEIRDEIVESEKEVLVEQKRMTEEDTEEGEMVEEWSEVTPEKASKSSNTLKYGQVKLLTPSRYSSLLEVDEKGDMINPIEVEEVLSIEEVVIEEEKETEENKKEEENADKKERKQEANEGSQDQNIAGLNSKDHWPDLASATRVRPSLPRKSKTLHKVVPEKPGHRGNKSTTNPSQ